MSDLFGKKREDILQVEISDVFTVLLINFIGYSLWDGYSNYKKMLNVRKLQEID